MKSGALEAVLTLKLGDEKVPARGEQEGRSGSLGLAHLGWPWPVVGIFDSLNVVE